MHLWLAIRAFFLILFGRALPLDFPLALLPVRAGEPDEKPMPPEPPAAPVEAEAAKTVKPTKVEAPSVAPLPPKGPPPDAIAVRAISVFQSEGRLFDFLSEDIDGYSDAEIGAAVREIHRGCRRALQDHFKLTRVRAEEEESLITVPEGYDPAEIRVVGNVVGRPPFSGTLKHKGWRVEEVHLPHIPDGPGAQVIAPAEVEV